MVYKTHRVCEPNAATQTYFRACVLRPVFQPLNPLAKGPTPRAMLDPVNFCSAIQVLDGP